MTSIGNIRVFTRFYDVKGLPWAVVIWDKNYSGEAMEIPMGGSPINIRWAGEGLKPIVGSEATLTYVTDENMSWLRNNAVDSLLVCVWKNPVNEEESEGASWDLIYEDYRTVTDEQRLQLWWVGYVLTDTYSRELKISATYTIQASDRLGNLENYDYATPVTGVTYGNRSEKVLNVLSKCFAAINLRFPIVSVMNLYELSMDTGDEDDPFDQMYIDELAFLDDEMWPNSVHEVLEKICLTFNCRIYQSGAQWIIARNQDFKTPTLKYRVYSYDSQDYDGATTVSLWYADSYTHTRQVDESDLLMIFCGMEEGTAAYRNITVTQDFGKRFTMCIGGGLPRNEFTYIIRDDLTQTEEIGIPKHWILSDESSWNPQFPYFTGFKAVKSTAGEYIIVGQDAFRSSTRARGTLKYIKSYPMYAYPNAKDGFVLRMDVGQMVEITRDYSLFNPKFYFEISLFYIIPHKVTLIYTRDNTVGFLSRTSVGGWHLYTRNDIYAFDVDRYPFAGVVDVPLVSSFDALNTTETFISPLDPDSYPFPSGITEEDMNTGYYQLVIYQPYNKGQTGISANMYLAFNNVTLLYGPVPEEGTSAETEIRFPNNYMVELTPNENNRVNVEYILPFGDRPEFDVEAKNMFAAYSGLINTRYWNSSLTANPDFVGTSTWNEPYSAGARSLWEWIIRWYEQDALPGSVFRGQLYGQIDYQYTFKIPVISNSKLYLPTDLTYDIKRCVVSVTAVELKGMLIPDSMTSEEVVRPSLLRRRLLEKEKQESSSEGGVKSGGISPWQVNAETNVIHTVGDLPVLMGKERPTPTEDGENLNEYGIPLPTSMIHIKGSNTRTIETGEVDSFGVLVLDIYHFLVVVSGESDEYPIQFPRGITCTGRIYGIKVTDVTNRVYAYVDPFDSEGEGESWEVLGEIEGADEETGELDFATEGTFWFQSDGVDWKRIGGGTDINFDGEEDYIVKFSAHGLTKTIVKETKDSEETHAEWMIDPGKDWYLLGGSMATELIKARGGDIYVQAGIGYWNRGGNVYIYGGWNVGGSGAGGGNVLLAYNGGAIGSVGVGIVPTAFLHLRAGEADPECAPMKFTTGVLLSSEEPGAFEYDGYYLYYTDVYSERHKLAWGGEYELLAEEESDIVYLILQDVEENQFMIPLIGAAGIDISVNSEGAVVFTPTVDPSSIKAFTIIALNPEVSFVGGDAVVEADLQESQLNIFTEGDIEVEFDNANKGIKFKSTGTAGETYTLSVEEDGDDVDLILEDSQSNTTAILLRPGTNMSISLDSDGAVVFDVTGGGSLEIDPTTVTFDGLHATFIAGENLVAGKLCYIKSDGKAWKTDANAIATCLGIAVATETITAESEGTFLMVGFIKGYTSLTVGGAVYASASVAGDLTQTIPSGTDDVGQIVGVAVSATNIYFLPSLTTIESK